MSTNPLRRLRDFGQSVYVDEIRRRWFEDGTLRDLVERDGLRGVTSNPAIFQKAIAESDDYDEAIAALAASGLDAGGIYEAVVIDDIARAADVFRPQYDESGGRYGFVSLEVDPNLAHDTDGTVAEAEHLWRRLERPNVFIKVPGTEAGIPAIERLIDRGINVNVTLLFGLERYRQAAEAYLRGLESRHARGESLRVASVASFFLSRIDVAIDPMLDEVAASGGEASAKAARLKGQIAVANAKLAFDLYRREVVGGDRWRTLEAAGAHPQRLLWASTGTKNPDYSDVLYVEPLIGEDTVNTMPTATLDAYRDHGDPAPRLHQGVEEARAALRELEALGIDLWSVTAGLEVEGIDKFVQPFDALMETLEAARAEAAVG